MISTLLLAGRKSRAAGSSILRTRCASSTTPLGAVFVVGRVAAAAGRRRFLATTTSTTSTAGALRPLRRNVSLEERAQLRAARKERATRLLQQQQQQTATEGTAAAPVGSSTAAAAASSSKPPSLAWSRWIWYLGLGIPTGLLVWGFQDEASPPAKLAKFIGLTGLIQGYTDQLAKPSYDKLLPDWSQVRTSPQRIALA